MLTHRILLIFLSNLLLFSFSNAQAGNTTDDPEPSTTIPLPQTTTRILPGTTTMSPNPPPKPTLSPDTIELITIIGSVFGGFVLIIIVIGICCCCCCKQCARMRELKFQQMLAMMRQQTEQVNQQQQVPKNSDKTEGNDYHSTPPKTVDDGGKAKDEWEVNRRCVSINFANKLGNGAFGFVYTGQLVGVDLSERKNHSIMEISLLRLSDHCVAVKVLPDYADFIARLNFLTEIGIMKGLEYHARLVNLIACVTTNEPHYLVMEFCANGDLNKFLAKKKAFLGELKENPSDIDQSQLLSLRQQLMFSVQICCGLEYLSQKGFVHRDIAARNILLDENLACKIGDFGLARHVEQAHDSYMSRGGNLPLKWMPPEAIIQCLFSTKSDVWSFGVVLFEIMTLGSPPYPEWAITEVLQRLNRGERMTKPEECPDEIFALMSSCWEHKPDDRPDFSQLREKIGKLLEAASDNNYYLQLADGKNYYEMR